MIVWHATAKKDTILYQYNDAKAYAWDSSGNQLPLLQSDSSTKALQKFYKLYYYRLDLTALQQLLTTQQQRRETRLCSGENPAIHTTHTKSAKRLLFGVSAIIRQKDTTVPEFERSSVDVEL